MKRTFLTSAAAMALTLSAIVVIPASGRDMLARCAFERCVARCSIYANLDVGSNRRDQCGPWCMGVDPRLSWLTDPHLVSTDHLGRARRLSAACRAHRWLPTPSRQATLGR